MATIRDSLREALAADSAVSGLVGDRIFPGQLPPDIAQKPWAYFIVTSEETQEGLDLDDGTAATVEFDLFDETYDGVVTLALAVRACLNGYRGGLISRCLWRSTAEDVVEGGYHSTLTFGVWN